MKIVQLASGDLWAGAEVQLYHMSCSLNKEKDIDLTIILFNSGQLEQKLLQSNIKVIVLDEKKYNSFYLFLSLKKLLGNLKPDLLHTHRTKENIIGGIVSFLSGCMSIRTVHGASEFDISIFNVKRFTFNLLDKIVGRFLQARIISVSSELKNKLMKDYPTPKITVIKNSVSSEYIHKQANVSIKHIFPENQFNICFIGRFSPVKRVDLFYDLAKSVLTSEPNLNIHFYMMGDGPLWEQYRELVSKDKLEKNIHLTGFVENTASYLKNMSLLIFTSDHEGLPMTLLEAMTLSVPVLARNNLITVGNVLCDGECGYFEPMDDIKTSTSRIIQILQNRESLNRKADLARKAIESDYLIENNVKDYIKLYHEVIN